jgi:urea carboxylase
MAAGRGEADIADGVFSMRDYSRFLADEAGPIAAFRAQQADAFCAERAAWDRAGEFATSVRRH